MYLTPRMRCYRGSPAVNQLYLRELGCDVFSHSYL